MACIEDFIDCVNKALSPMELFKLLLAKVGVVPNEKPAIRVCVSNADELGGLNVKHFVAGPGQTIFTMDEPIRRKVFYFKQGAAKHSFPVSAVVGQNDVELPAQVDGTEISIIT